MKRPMKYASAPIAIDATSTAPKIESATFWKNVGSGPNEITPLMNGTGGARRTPKSVAIA